MLHAHDCAQKDLTKILIRTEDTDVVVLSVTFFKRISAQEIWIAFGTGKQYRYISVHEIVSKLAQEDLRP